MSRKTEKTMESGGEYGRRFGRSIDQIVVHARANNVVSADDDDSGKQAHHHSVLTKMLSAASEDHAQLRSLIYESARRKLRKDLLRQFEDGDWSEIKTQVCALEAAINQVEAQFSHDVPRLSLSPEAKTTSDRGHDDSRVVALPLPPISRKEFMAGNDSNQNQRSFFAPDELDRPTTVLNYVNESPASRRAKSIWRVVEVIIALGLGIAVYSSKTADLTKYPITPTAATPPTTTSDEARIEPKPYSRPGISGIPLPSAYGVYALSDDKLTALDLLPIRIPDPRVAISAMISTPSLVHLPAGPLQFVVYRRDLADEAPDRVTVRVIAQIVRALIFSPAGKATYQNVEQSWMVRSNSYQMSVAPAANSPEMVVIKSDQSDFKFPAGRYALLLGKEAYDFTLDGPPDPAHCLERTDALGGAVYSECAKFPR